MVEQLSDLLPDVHLEQLVDIQRVPLLLAFPTLLLASNLIFDKPGHPDLPLGQLLPLTVVIIPLFLAAVTTSIFTLMTAQVSVRKKGGNVWETNRVLMSFFGVFTCAWILGSVRTVMLSLVLIMNVHISFMLASVGFDVFSLYVKGKLHFLPTELSHSNIYFIIGAYIILFSIKGILRNVDHFTKENNLWTALGAGLVSGAVLLWQIDKLQISMILVTLGCFIVIVISKMDLQTFEFKKGSVTVMGVVSIMLEILSLNSNYTQYYFLTFCEFALIASTLLIEVDDTLFKSVESMPANEEINIFKQLYQYEDTRAIFSFLLLNTSFMFVQFLYSFRSKSLGLLSDSLHMALDCTSLALGLIAGVLAKRPPSEWFPFGLTKIETLAGFANGVLLIGIVAGIVVQAIERIINPVNLEKTGELLVVSFLGFVVNIVGIFAFNHGHEHGGHSHGHTHSHVDGDGSNENMQGIFLHILADTLGSAGVVVSTLLTSFFHSNIFDPIASLFIAVMIFFSAVPLIKSSAANLLLNLDDKKDEQIRDLLNQIAMTPGVTGYTTPRFWNSTDIATSSAMDHAVSKSVSNRHSHGITHSHEHMHSHDNEHSHEHSHEHSRDHDHDHDYDHDYVHKEGSCTEGTKGFTLVGFIHIQYLEGENSTIIKKRVQKIFENQNIKAMIQVENEGSSCWCRTPT